MTRVCLTIAFCCEPIKFGKTIATDLFDYERDPLEKTNLAGAAEDAALIKDLATKLRRDAQGCERLFQK